jgi:DNA-binding Xre family transcriptional regulator
VPIARRLFHERRLALVQLLLRGPWNVAELGQAVGMSRNTLNGISAACAMRS